MKRKEFICGLTVGALIMTSAPVLADNISVVLDNSIKMIIDGNAKTLPEGYSILNYEGRTYLPTRYVAEELGAAVNWDEAGRTITITPPEPEIVEKVVEKVVEVPVEVEKIVYVENNDKSSNYDTLPTSLTKASIGVTVKNIRNIKEGALSDYSRVNIEVENETSSDNVMLEYEKAVIVADGVNYNLIDTSFSVWDQKFMGGDIQPGDEVSGYLVFPLIDSKAKEFTLKLPVRNQQTKTVTNFEFDFTADISDD